MWWREVSESEKAAEVIRVKQWSRTLCVYYTELNPSVCGSVKKCHVHDVETAVEK